METRKRKNTLKIVRRASAKPYHSIQTPAGDGHILMTSRVITLNFFGIFGRQLVQAEHATLNQMRYVHQLSESLLHLADHLFLMHVFRYESPHLHK